MDLCFVNLTCLTKNLVRAEMAFRV